MTESTQSQSSSAMDSNKVLEYSGIMITAVVGAVATWSVSASPQFIWVGILAALQLGLFMVFLRTVRREQMILLFILQALCIVTLLFLVPSDFIVILSVVWLVQSVELYGMRRSMQSIPVILGIFALAQVMHGGIGDWFGILISLFLYGLLQLFAVSVVQQARSEREGRERTAELNRELLATRELLSQSSAQSERLRIARDLHDILGHHMTALILNLEVASHSVEGQSKEKVEQSLALAKLLLSDLRNTVSELRDESTINLEESITKLVAGIPGYAIDVDFSEAPAIDDVDMAETFLRCAQEGVTNVLRHSNADQCRIAMSGSPQNCTLLIADNGKSSHGIEPGNGLTGMQERVQARGGELHWHRDQHGFQLQVTLSTESAP